MESSKNLSADNFFNHQRILYIKFTDLIFKTRKINNLLALSIFG